MPSVFIIGDFMAQIKSGILCGVILSKRKNTYNCGEYLNDFGKIEYCADVTVPKDAKAVEIKETNLYTCLFADNTVMDEKICSPYIFDVCEALRGKKLLILYGHCK